jgi:hypothetical protein
MIDENVKTIFVDDAYILIHNVYYFKYKTILMVKKWYRSIDRSRSMVRPSIDALLWWPVILSDSAGHFLKLH